MSVTHHGNCGFAAGTELEVYTLEAVEERMRSGTAPDGIEPLEEATVEEDGTQEVTLTGSGEYAYYAEVPSPDAAVDVDVALTVEAEAETTEVTVSKADAAKLAAGTAVVVGSGANIESNKITAVNTSTGVVTLETELAHAQAVGQPLSGSVKPSVHRYVAFRV